MAQFDMHANSGLEKPWQAWGEHLAEIREPLVIDQRALDSWGMTDEAQAGMEALMALMPEAGYAPTDTPADQADTGV